MTAPTHTIEKPAHIDERRMRHISDADLFAALDLTRPALAAVRAAVAAEDWTGAYQAWANYMAARAQPVGVLNLYGYARLDPALRRARGAPILAQARQVAEAPMDFTGASHGRTPLYGVHYMQWMLPLLQGYALERDPAFAGGFARLFNHWYETRDQVFGEIETLDVIWYTLGLAHRSLVWNNAYLAFKGTPALDAPTQARLLKALLGAARWLAEEHDTFLYGNWQVTGVGALFEMGVLWPEFVEAARWREIGWQRLLDHLDLDVFADGGHSERTPSYHQHVLACLARAASVAELNGQPPLQAQPRFAAMYRWLVEQTTPLGGTTNFNDSHIVWPYQWVLQGAVLLEDPALKGLAEHFGTPEQIAWGLAYLPDRPGRTAAEVYTGLPGRAPDLQSALLAASKFALLRGGSGDTDELYMAINYGPLMGHEYESHSHFDTLAFVCTGFGQPLAVEPGLPLSSYDDPLYKTWIRSAGAHNMLTVDGASPAEQHKEANLIAWSASPVADFFEAGHPGYQSLGVQHRRAILFVKGEYWIVYDEALQTGRHRLEWRLYPPQPFTLEAGRVWPARAPGLAVLPVLPTGEPRFEPLHGRMALPQPAGLEGASEFREVQGFAHVRESAAPRTVFVHVLFPVREQMEPAALTARPIAFEAGEAGVIEHAGNSDVFLVRAQPGGSAAAAGWRTDARVAWLRSAEHWAIYEARQLALGEQTLLASSETLKAMSLRRSGGGLAGDVETQRQTELTLFVHSPVEAAFLNGVRLPTAWLIGQAVRLLLISAGTHHFEIVCQP
jgi:hypothetical protein